MNVSPAHVMNESFLPSFLSLCIESRLLFLSFVFLASPFPPFFFSFLSVFLAGLCRLTPLGGCRRCKGPAFEPDTSRARTARRCGDERNSARRRRNRRGEDTALRVGVLCRRLGRSTSARAALLLLLFLLRIIDSSRLAGWHRASLLHSKWQVVAGLSGARGEMWWHGNVTAGRFR